MKLDDLFRHQEWADATMWRAVLAEPLAADDNRTRDLLFHIHMTQKAFLTVWVGGMPEEREFREKPRMSLLLEIAQDNHERMHRIMAQLNKVPPVALDEPKTMPWADRFIKGAKPTTLGETMLQLILHSTHHRGQVNARLRELGAEPPLVDYIAWIWMGRPAAEWPELVYWGDSALSDR